MAKASTFEWIVWILVTIGALNWGLVGFFDFDLVTTIFGTGMGMTIVYDIIGLAGLYAVWLLFKYCKKKK